jgi:DNA (cytosine-5)-methyltransferase 1
MDLFAGCGGMTRGFVDSTLFEPMLAIEVDADAAATYRANFRRHPLVVSKIEEVDDFPTVDVVIGGPPCQAFSSLNRTGAGSERRSLWREYLRALRASDAEIFVMENVPQLLKSSEYLALTKAARRMGYDVEAFLLNAADYGVPQTRRRAIIIGSRSGPPLWPTPTHSHPGTFQSGLRPWQTFREAVSGLPIRPDGVNWHRARNPRPESIVRYKAVPPDGGNRFQMQDTLQLAGRSDLVLPCFRKKPTGTTDVFGRLWWDRPAVTIRTEFYKPEKGRYLHPVADRAITVREGARLMSFSDDFRFPEEQSMTSVGRQIGNAVPPLLAKHVALAVAATLDASVSRAA